MIPTSRFFHVLSFVIFWSTDRKSKSSDAAAAAEKQRSRIFQERGCVGCDQPQRARNQRRD